MAYSKAGIVNLALNKIGAKKIAALTDATPQAIQANVVWEYILDEVLEAADWNFAKIRLALSVSTITPQYTYDYAYPLPADFLRLAHHSPDDPAVYPGDESATDYPYAIETLSDGNLALLTNFDNSDGYDLYIKYIKRVTDPAKFSPGFINALSWRLAAELSIYLTEGNTKFDFCMKMFAETLAHAEGLNSQDFIEYETGDDSWVNAGGRG